MEASILKSVAKLKSIVGFVDFFFTKSCAWLVMEYVPGVDLIDWLKAKPKGISEPEAREVFRSISETVAFLHSNEIVHRDLKPDNIMMGLWESDKTVKVIDFGFAKRTKCGEMLETPCGTAVYAAPEIMQQVRYTKAVDCWSLGIILFIILFEYPPFFHKNEDTMQKMIECGHFSYPPPTVRKATDTAKDLINKLLIVDPNKRLTSDAVLKHPWFQMSPANADANSDPAIEKADAAALRTGVRKVLLCSREFEEHNLTTIPATVQQQDSPSSTLQSVPETETGSPRGVNASAGQDAHAARTGSKAASLAAPSESTNEKRRKMKTKSSAAAHHAAATS